MEKELLLKAYRDMLTIRRFEEVLTKHYLDEKVFSFVHFYTGSEASAVGVSLNLVESDKMFGTHRSHGHYLAKGGCPTKLAAEMLGKVTGCAKGRGGSMHPVSRDTGFLGTSPILGSSIPLSVGAAFAEKFNKTGNICVGFTGDGAAEEGLKIEALNLAAAWNLPHITVIENNNWSVLTHVSARRGFSRDNHKFYTGLGVEYLTANGTNFIDVYLTAKRAVEYARHNIPVVLEIFTHRFLAHSTPLLDHHLGHRSTDTKEIMEKEDCLEKLASILEKDEILEIQQAVEELIRKALQTAIESPMPDKNTLKDYIYR